MIDWLIACIPILSFGLLPVVAAWIGGKPVQQSMGVALGSLFFAIVVAAVRTPHYTTFIFMISMLSGLFWAVGSLGQFMGISYLGVAKSTPICNGGQIIGTSLLGVMLGEWAGTTAKIYGFTALAFIILGIVLTSYHDSSHPDSVKPKWKQGIWVNILSALGFTCYVGILKYFKIDGWTSILPQSFGQICGVILIALLFFRTWPVTKTALKNTIGGLIWAAGNIALLLSQASLGLSIAYPLSQTAIIVSVLGGVFINKERKTRKEWVFTLSGMAVIVVGMYLIYMSGTR